MRTVHDRLLPALLVLGLAASPLAAAAQQRVAVPERARVIASKPAELFRIGAEQGESWELLSNVRAVAFDRDDNLYVLDAGNYRVLVFDRSGKFIRQIGKQGEGPGEITFAQGMVVDAGGDVVVYDMGRGGFTVYGQDGTYKTTITGAQDSRLLGGSGFQAAPRGGVVARSTTMLRPGARGDGPGAAAIPDGPIKSPIIHHPLTTNGQVRTLYELEMPAPKVVESGSATNRRVMVSLAPPIFTPPIAWGILPTGGLALSTSAEYAIQVLDATGKVQRVFTTGKSPREVTNRDREQAREQRREAMRNPSGGGMTVRSVNGQTSFSFGGSGPALSDAQIEDNVRSLEFAEVVPLVRSLFTDGLGRIWVVRTSDDNPTENGVLDLLDHTGRYIGSLRDESMPSAVSGSGLAAYVTRDDLDIEQVVVKQLPADWK